MTDLIKRGDAINVICEGFVAHPDRDCAGCGAGAILKRIAKIKAVDAVELRHGRWKKRDCVGGGTIYACSECRAGWALDWGSPAENHVNYCPECGAKMDGGENDE